MAPHSTSFTLRLDSGRYLVRSIAAPGTPATMWHPSEAPSVDIISIVRLCDGRGGGHDRRRHGQPRRVRGVGRPRGERQRRRPRGRVMGAARAPAPKPPVLALVPPPVPTIELIWRRPIDGYAYPGFVSLRRRSGDASWSREAIEMFRAANDDEKDFASTIVEWADEFLPSTVSACVALRLAAAVLAGFAPAGQPEQRRRAFRVIESGAT